MIKDNLKILRAQRGVTIRTVATLTKIPFTTWHSFEEGTLQPTKAQVETMAAYFKVTEFELTSSNLTKSHALTREQELERISQNLKFLRSNRGISQYEMAALISKDKKKGRESIQAWELKRSVPKQASMLLLARFFNIAPDDIRNLELRYNMPNERLPVLTYNVAYFASVADLKEDKSEHYLAIPGAEQHSFALVSPSTHGTIQKGDIIIIKQITDLDILYIGKPHLIITKEHSIIETITERTKTQITAGPTIPISKIQSIYQITHNIVTL